MGSPSSKQSLLKNLEEFPYYLEKLALKFNEFAKLLKELANNLIEKLLKGETYMCAYVL